MLHDPGDLSGAEVAAIFARLRAEIRAGPASDVDGESAAERAVGAGPLRARAEAERLWAVTAERGVVRRPGLKGAIAQPIKRLLRPFLRWYVEPALADQRQFNVTVLQLVDELADRVRELEHGLAGRATRGDADHQ